MKLYFKGNKKQLRAFLQLLLEQHGEDALISEIPTYTVR